MIVWAIVLYERKTKGGTIGFTSEVGKGADFIVRLLSHTPQIEML